MPLPPWLLASYKVGNLRLHDSLVPCVIMFVDNVFPCPSDAVSSSPCCSSLSLSLRPVVSTITRDVLGNGGCVCVCVFWGALRNDIRRRCWHCM